MSCVLLFYVLVVKSKLMKKEQDPPLITVGFGEGRETETHMSSCQAGGLLNVFCLPTHFQNELARI